LTLLPFISFFQNHISYLKLASQTLHQSASAQMRRLALDLFCSPSLPSLLLSSSTPLSAPSNELFWCRRVSERWFIAFCPLHSVPPPISPFPTPTAAHLTDTVFMLVALTIRLIESSHALSYLMAVPIPSCNSGASFPHFFLLLCSKLTFTPPPSSSPPPPPSFSLSPYLHFLRILLLYSLILDRSVAPHQQFIPPHPAIDYTLNRPLVDEQVTACTPCSPKPSQFPPRFLPLVQLRVRCPCPSSTFSASCSFPSHWRCPYASWDFGSRYLLLPSRGAVCTFLHQCHM
jgi:hypothetical protein